MRFKHLTIHIFGRNGSILMIINLCDFKDFTFKMTILVTYAVKNLS